MGRRRLAEALECLFAGGGEVYLVALELEGAAKGLPNGTLVVDDKDSHRRNCALRNDGDARS